MSGLKDPAVAQVLRMVRFRMGRRGGLGTVCDLAQLGRAHVSQVINGRNGRHGFSTWARLRRHLTRGEWAEMEKSSAWNTFASTYPLRAAEARQVPTCDDPRHPLMPVVCSVCGCGIEAKTCVPEVAGRASHGLCDTHFREMMGQIGAPVPPAHEAELPLSSR